MKILGLTGGIGTGKSTVSEYLKTKGCTIIDADAISRGMTEKGSPALDEIKNCFGEEYFFLTEVLTENCWGILYSETATNWRSYRR